jgi:hypothetical protein
VTDSPRRTPLGELLAFLASALAGLRVLRRRPPPLPEVPVVNGADAKISPSPDVVESGKQSER